MAATRNEKLKFEAKNKINKYFLGMKFPSTTTRSVRNENVGRRSRLRANLSLPLGSLLTSELVSSSTRGLHPDRLAMHSCRHQREDGEDGEEKKEKEKKSGGVEGG